MTKIKFRVNTIESERGWGRTYDHVDFDTYEKAAKYRDDINAYNTEDDAPDWYMIAEKEIRVVEVK